MNTRVTNPNNNLRNSNVKFEKNQLNSKKVLIFTKATDYVHESLPFAATYCSHLCSEFGWQAIISDDSSVLEESNACVYDIIVFVNNSGKLFNVEKEVLSNHIANGRGVLGLHSALAAFLDGQDATGITKLGSTNNIMQDVFGTHFLNHAPIQTARIFIDKEITKTFNLELNDNLSDTFLHTDEFFNYTSNPCDKEDIKVIAYVDENSYEGGLMGARHPVVWYRYYGEKKAPIFYCALGHFSHFYNIDNIMNSKTVSFFLRAGLKFVSNYPN